MASHPPAQCCTIGVAHEGNTKGEIQQFGGVQAYIAKPAENLNPKNQAILILTDVFGHELKNAQLIADQFAANGYFVVMPDLLHGDAIPFDRRFSFDIQAWLKGPPGHNPSTIDPVMTSVLKELRTSLGYERVGAVGYCFGAKYVVRFLHPAEKGIGIDVGYVAHPSWVEASELSAIQGPLSISAAGNDFLFPTEKRRESEDILPKTGQPYQINLFSGVEHGFAVRGDPKQPVQKFAKEQAFLQAVQWFTQYL